MKAAMMYYIILYSFNLHNLETLFSSQSKQEEQTYIHFKVSFLYHHKTLFLNYNIFHKFFIKKKKFIRNLYYFKLPKNNNETWLGLSLFKKF